MSVSTRGRRVVVQALQDPHEGWADLLGALEAGQGVVAGEGEEVVAFVRGQAQGPGEGGGDLDGGLRGAPLFADRF
jgi:hypothetical protein